MISLQLVTQVFLPLFLALMMFAMGLSLTLADFKRVLLSPKPVLIGILLQLLLLPLVALLLISLIQTLYILPSSIILGLLILAACPGGATSNIISHLSGGDGALSITMTAVVSLLVPFIVPFSLVFQLSLFNQQDLIINLPILKTIFQLLAVTVVPVILAMLIRHFWLAGVVQIEPFVRKSSSVLFFVLIVTMSIMQWPKLQEIGIEVAFLCLALCLITMLITVLISNALGLKGNIRKTLAIEVGIQNAGTGMFIAGTLLLNPDLALIPLMYGLVMNIPAIALIMNNLRKAKV